jgi:hypothetical protein
MFHVYAVRFDVTKNFEFFLDFEELKKVCIQPARIRPWDATVRSYWRGKARHNKEEGTVFERKQRVALAVSAPIP